MPPTDSSRSAIAGASRAELAATGGRRRPYLTYLVLVGLPLLGLLLVLSFGRSLSAPPAPPQPTDELTTSVGFNPTLRIPVFLAQIIVILLAARMVGKALRRIGQPQVVGEMVAGLLLGPSALGLVAPGAYSLLFPLGTVRFLGALSQIGLLLFMFLLGLELDPDAMKGRGETAVLTSHVSIVSPMFLGSLLALVLYPRLSNASVSFDTFALFVGTALAVTAFPVLARMLTERGIERTPLGTIAIACAAVDDVTAWCLLGAITALARPDHDAGGIALSLIGLGIYLLTMFVGVRPLLRRLVRAWGGGEDLGHDSLSVILAFALASAWLTDRIGVHALFGAFIAGVVLPRDRGIADSLRRRTEDLLLVLLLPLFFVATGIRTDVTVIRDAALLLPLTIACAIAGKLGGSAIAARAAGMTWRDGLALGSLLNARGLIGLVVINVGFDEGVISSPLYAILVVTAVVTTLLAAPLLDLIYRRSPPDTGPGSGSELVEAARGT